MPDLASDIATQALEPASTSVAGQTTSARPVTDQIKGDVYAGEGKTASGQRRRGIMFSKLTAPGAVSDQGQVQTVTPFNGGIV